MYKNPGKMEWEKFFFLIEIFIYLAPSGLSCDTQDPGWGVCDLPFWLKGSSLQYSGLVA